MKILSTIFGIMVLTFSLFAVAEEGCKYDTQCKGERICVKGECVDQSSSQLPAKPIESQSETKTEKSVFIGDWNVDIEDAKTKLIKGGDLVFSKYAYFEDRQRTYLEPGGFNTTYKWRITSSNDSLNIEIIDKPEVRKYTIETKIRNVKHKNNLVTFTEERKGEGGLKESIQYYLKSVNEDKIEGEWKSQGYYRVHEWEIDGNLVMTRIFPSREPKQPGTTLHQEKEKPREELRQSQPQSNQSVPYHAPLKIESQGVLNSSEGLSDANRSQCYLRCNSEQDSCNARCSNEADAERAQGGISTRAAPCLSSCLQRVQNCMASCR